METINFRNCTLLSLERKLGVAEVEMLNSLHDLISQIKNYEIDTIEKQLLLKFQKMLIYRVHDWNEQELIEHFIAPVFSIVSFNTEKYGMFSWRPMTATIGEIILTGNPDAIVAKGRREPEIPYFCFHEYKKEKESENDPQGQCLAAMIVAQELNNNDKPIYGVVVKGEKWQFMALKGKEYAISNSYKATDEELFEIIKLLKHLKTIIEEYVKS
jgi:hypothetical protein